MDRIKALAPDHPEWKIQQPFKAVLDNDLKELGKYGVHGILELVIASHADMTTTEFETIVKEWLATAKHPRFDKPFTDLVYQPMLELLQFLRDNDFKTFIVSGGGIEFMRPWVEEVYGIPPDQVVGSSIKTEYDYNNGNPAIKRLPEMDFIDDGSGKPIGIHKFIGKKPVFASGNSDADREWAYDRESHFGRLDKGLDEAEENGWTVIDMKKDWKLIYPDELIQ